MRPKLPTLLRAIVRLGRGWVWVPVVSFVFVVAVAMGCAVWSPLDGQIKPPFSPFGNWEVESSEPRYDNIPAIDGFKAIGFGVRLYYYEPDFYLRDSFFMTGRANGVAIGEAGFPFRCLRFTHDTRNGDHDSSLWDSGIDTPLMNGLLGAPRRIPLMPEPVGMVLNVLIYSAVIALPRYVWRRAVVFRRRTKGLCVKCGYPMGEFTVCPECGGSIESS